MSTSMMSSGLYIGKYLLTGGEGDISQCHLGEKNMKRQRENGGTCRRKRKKGERKRKKGKIKLKTARKRVK
jgi:hypothetical protein